MTDHLCKGNKVKVYAKKELNFGFVIISPTHNLGLLKSTTRSIRSNCPEATVVCVTSDDAIAVDIKEMKEVCPTYRGKNTITSLINTGLKKGNKEWNFIIIEGTIVRKNFHKKFIPFVVSEKDILFPIITEYNYQGKPTKIRGNFPDCTLNGILIHQTTFKKVGNFSDNPLEITKLMWAMEAIEKGCIFKGILGAKL